MKNRIPIHLYSSFDRSDEAVYSEVKALWLEVRTTEELKNLKKQSSTRSGPAVIPVIKDPSLIEVYLADAHQGIAVPFRFKDELLHLSAQINTTIYLIEEEFMKTRADDEILASLKLIRSSVFEMKKAGIRNLTISLFHPEPVIHFKSNQYLKKELDLNHIISLVPLPDYMENIVRNTLAISALFYEQIGSVLLIKPREKEQTVSALELGRNVLANLKLYGRTHTIISCPGCGRCQWDLEPMTRRIKTVGIARRAPARPPILKPIIKERMIINGLK